MPQLQYYYCRRRFPSCSRVASAPTEIVVVGGVAEARCGSLTISSTSRQRLRGKSRQRDVPASWLARLDASGEGTRGYGTCILMLLALASKRHS